MDKDSSNMVERNYWLDYIKKNPFSTVVNMSLVMGDVLFLIYFFHIGYMPILDLPNTIHLLFAISLTGVWTMVMLVGLLILPSLFWEQYQKDISKGKNQKQENKLFLILLLAFHVVAGSIEAFSYSQEGWWRESIIVSILIIEIIYLWTSQEIEKKVLFFISSLVIICISMLSWISIIPIFMGGNIPVILGILLGIAAIVGLNTFILQEKDYIKGFIGGFLILVILMFFSTNYNLLSSVFVRNLHLGEYVLYQVDIKKQSCSFLKRYDNSMIQSENNKSCVISKLNVLLSLGKEVLLQVKTQEDGNISVVIPAEDIISYSWKNKPKNSKTNK